MGRPRVPDHHVSLCAVYVQVMRWMEVLGSERVLLVTAEEMAQQPKALFDRTLAFLGLCGFDFTYTAENVRGMQVR